MTRKLYYEDCHLREFSARVLSCDRTEKGWEVTLDATAFYPEGGGQACDTGTLGDTAVTDVRERGEAIIHLCGCPLAVGSTVAGRIDWDRRFDLMQQHTGEHIVSGVIHRRFGYANVGFHVGADTVTIDFDGPIPAETLPRIEAEANDILWRNIPVRCWIPDPQTLPGVSYRAKRQLPWPVRIVDIPGGDTCACCGVHVAHTGEVGLVKLFSCVKFHQGVRIEMACGGRALGLLNSCYEQNRQVSQAFSAKLWETGDAARRMNEALGREKLRAAALQKQVFDMTAQSYAGQDHVLHKAQGLEPGQTRALAEAIAGKVTGVAAVLSGESLCMIGPEADIRALGAALKKTGARGGGKSGSWQGSVSTTPEEMEELLQNLHENPAWQLP